MREDGVVRHRRELQFRHGPCKHGRELHIRTLRCEVRAWSVGRDNHSELFPASRRDEAESGREGDGQHDKLLQDSERIGRGNRLRGDRFRHGWSERQDLLRDPFRRQGRRTEEPHEHAGGRRPGHNAGLVEERERRRSEHNRLLRFLWTGSKRNPRDVGQPSERVLVR